MGADFLAISFSVPIECPPDWERAHKFISAITVEDMSTENWKELLDNEFEGECLDQSDGSIPVGPIQNRLHVMLDVLQEELHGRSVTYIGDRMKRHYVAGGFSWGDSPSDAFNIMITLAKAGVLDHLDAKPLECTHHTDVLVKRDGVDHVLGIYFIPEISAFVGLDVSNPNETLPSPYNPGHLLKLPGETHGKGWPLEITHRSMFTDAVRDPDSDSTCQCWDDEKGRICGKPATVRVPDGGCFCSLCTSNQCSIAKQVCLEAKADYDLAVSRSNMWLEALSHVTL